MSTAVDIARAAADLISGHVNNTVPEEHPSNTLKRGRVFDRALSCIDPDITVVDASYIGNEILSHPRSIHLFDDYPCIFPPWNTALICVKSEGTIIINQLVAVEHDGPLPWEKSEDIIERYNVAHPDNPVPDDDGLIRHVATNRASEVVESDGVQWERGRDTSRVKWVMNGFTWMGGHSQEGHHIPISGPLHSSVIAVNEDGSVADLRMLVLSQDLEEGDWLNDDKWDKWNRTNMAVLMGTLNFMNCRNIELVEPTRPRAERRNIARTGVRVHTINLLPVGKSTRGPRREGDGVPLTSVRGHLARYGPEYDRGLLFGKYSGRFWIPQHARGDAALGQSKHDYKLSPESEEPETP